MYVILPSNPTQRRLKICPLCAREIPARLESKHHLVPKLKGGAHGTVVVLHRACHSKIHAVFTEAELARTFDTIEKILGNPEMDKFAKWIAKRPIDFDDGTKSRRRLRRQRHRAHHAPAATDQKSSGET